MKILSDKQKKAIRYLKRNRVGDAYRGDLHKLVEAFTIIKSFSKNHPLIK